MARLPSSSPETNAQKRGRGLARLTPVSGAGCARPRCQAKATSGPAESSQAPVSARELGVSLGSEVRWPRLGVLTAVPEAGGDSFPEGASSHL